MNRWYMQDNDEMDIAVSSRVRLARNLAEVPFYSKMTDEDKKYVVDKVEESINRGYFGENQAIKKIEIENLTQSEKIMLVENHLVSTDFIKNPSGRALFLSKDNSISIMVNEEDHVRIQALSSGNNIEYCYEVANNIDNLLDASLKYAFDSKLGFLTHCPTNIGTGMRASVMLHIPMIEGNSYLQSISKYMNKLGLTIRGTYGEGSAAIGAYYQLSNQTTLGITEETSIKNLNYVINQMIENERKLRDKHINLKIEDKIYRIYGVMKYARKLRGEELQKMTSLLRLGIYYKYFKKIKYKDINEIMFNLSAVDVDNTMTEDDIDVRRARQVRKKLIKIEKEKEVDINV